MQITSANSFMPNYSKLNQQEQYLKDSNILPTQDKQQEIIEQEPFVAPVGEFPRQTYGLSILETMSDDDYRAFTRATAEMTEGEKIMAAQALYRSTNFYQGKTQQEQESKNPYQEHSKEVQEFLQMYENARKAIAGI
ncbi:hypothetical protein BBW65_06915 [Helicobacter enhydrae]|uniref:Uncharacterized protein n=1 Tax=Helicobacter enhydrae TaxID=222136 RepID=A0A1B1U718_9HELI|nr:hypothetical protein [Helicobacter enhydrae]ANV98540.1 hypothetical protein BBW65_06915 [Helicobacter enhydrae]